MTDPFDGNRLYKPPESNGSDDSDYREWGVFDVRDLKKYCGSRDYKTVHDIALKLRRIDPDVEKQMKRLNLKLSTDEPQEYTIIPKQKQVVKKGEIIPDEGRLLVDIKNDLPMLRGEIREVGENLSKKIDQLIIVISQNTAVNERTAKVLESAKIGKSQEYETLCRKMDQLIIINARTARVLEDLEKRQETK